MPVGRPRDQGGVGGDVRQATPSANGTGAPSGFPPRAPEVARCYRCTTAKPVTEFAIDRSKGSGRKSICRSCDRAKAKRYYEQNGERVRARVNARNAEQLGETPGGTWAEAAAAPTDTEEPTDLPVYEIGRVT